MHYQLVRLVDAFTIHAHLGDMGLSIARGEEEEIRAYSDGWADVAEVLEDNIPTGHMDSSPTTTTTSLGL